MNVVLYDSLAALDANLEDPIDADVVMIGSYVPEGARVAEWALSRTRGVSVFYDIDTPVTLANLEQGNCSYLTTALVPEFDLYLSFTGGEVLHVLERLYGAQRARPLYCSVDMDDYFPDPAVSQYDLAYLGTFSHDRQPKLEKLLNEPARRWPTGRFCVAGAQYPKDFDWPANVQRIQHLPPQQHRRFYNQQRFTLNVTREDMVHSGYSPSVRLFEAAACGTPIISDDWRGLADFFTPGEEILVARTSEDVLRFLQDMAPNEAQALGARARSRVLTHHTSDHRAKQFESHIAEVSAQAAGPDAHHSANTLRTQAGWAPRDGAR